MSAANTTNTHNGHYCNNVEHFLFVILETAWCAMADTIKKSPSSYAVTYIASGLHPCCPELVAHYYALKLKKKTAIPSNTSFRSTAAEESNAGGGFSPRLRSPVGGSEGASGAGDVMVIVVVLEYDYLVHTIFSRLSARRSANVFRRQVEECREGHLPPWSIDAGFVEREWESLTCHASPGDNIVRALRASRVSTLFFPDSDAAAAFHQRVAVVADRGGHVLSQYDLVRDVMSTVTAYGCSSLISGDGAVDDVTKLHPTSNDMIFVRLTPKNAANGDDDDAGPGPRRSSSYAAQTFHCCMPQDPRPIIRKSPRTHALWMRTQLMRDAVDMLMESDARGGRRQVVDPLLDGQLWLLMAQPADTTLVNAMQPRTMPSRVVQISQIRQTFDAHGGSSHDAIFLPRFRIPLHIAGGPSRVGRSIGGMRSGVGDSIYTGGVAQLSLRYQGHADPNAITLHAAGGSSSASLALEARTAALQRQIPRERAIAILKEWLDILIHLAPTKPWLLATVMHEASSITGFVDVVDDTGAGGGGGELYPATRPFLLELEKLRRRRLAMVQSVVVTASVAAKNDLTQSKLVRIVETWVRERFEKTVGQVGNLVGARMTVEPNWNTEAHPVFGLTMRATHFPFFAVDDVMLDGCMTPLVPLPVMRCRNEWRRVVQLDPVLYRFRTLTVHLATTVAKLSKRLVCSPGDLSLLPNRESAIATILRSLPLLPGDSLLLVDPPIDGAFTNMASFLERRCGVEVQVLRLDPYASQDALQRAFSMAIERVNPVLCMINWVAPSTRVLPVEYFVSLCGQKAILSLVDGTDAVGNISVSVTTLDCDVFVARLDNYMFAPLGVTALVVKPKMNKLLTTLTVSYYYRPPVYGDAEAQVAADTGAEDAREGMELFTAGTQVSPWGNVDELVDDPSAPAATLEGAFEGNTSMIGPSHGAPHERHRGGGDRHSKAFSTGIPVIGGSVYGSEWWYTGLSDMSSALAVTQGLQFKKFICFGAKEYCFRIAQEAEEFLCRVWQVKPLLPTQHSLRHSILCVEVPRSHGKSAPDAAHMQQQFRDHNVCVTVLALPLPPASTDAPQHPATASTSVHRAKHTTLLAVRITVQVYNSMRDIKCLAAAGIRIVSSSGW